MTKVNVLFGFLAVLVLMFSIGQVSAQSGVQGALDNFASQVSPVLSWALGDVSGSGDVLFVKLMVFVLLLVIVGMAVRNVPTLGNNTWVVIILSVVVSLLATRFITTENLVNLIWLPYGVLGVTLSALLPFILAYFFLQSFESSIIRKVGWSAFVVIFAGLAYARWNEFADSEAGFNLGWIYVGVAVLAGSMIVFDKWWRWWRMRAHVSKLKNRQAQIQAIDIEDQIEALQRKLASASTDEQRRAVRAELQQKQDALDELFRNASG